MGTIKWFYNPIVTKVGETVLQPELLKFLASQGVDTSGLVGLHIADTENSSLDLVSEMAGRMCYMSFEAGRPTKEYLKNILDQKHGSVLEHASITYFIAGISRSLTHELVRHRVGVAYSQLSQRYVAFEKEIGFVIPPEYIGTEMEERFMAYVTRQYETYCMMLARTKQINIPAKGSELRKRIQQSSRSILPNCTETKMAVTFNLRALRHFLEMRGSLQADPEIRRLACALYQTVRGLHSFQDIKFTALEDMDSNCFPYYLEVGIPGV